MLKNEESPADIEMKKNKITGLRILRDFLGFLLVIAIIVLINICIQYYQMSSRNEQIQQLVLLDEEEIGTKPTEEENVLGNEESQTYGVCLPKIDFDALKAVNENAVGWIYACNGDINYPIAASLDEFYLKHAIDGSKSKSGAIFVNSNPDEVFPDTRSVIYGHNMRDGSMFHALLQYWRDENYLEQNPYIYIITEHATYIYEVSSIYVAEYEEIVWTPNVNPEAGKIIDLITCEYSGEDTRLVVEAVECEKLEEHIVY